MLDKNSVGRTTPPTLNEIEKGVIRRFAESLGDYNPIFYDEEYAKAAGFPSIVAPPTFPYALQTGADLRELLGVPLRALLHAEAALSFERPIYAGDRLLVTSRVAEVLERPGPTGKMEMAVIEDEGKDEAGHLVYRLRRTYLVRGTKEST